MAIEKIIIYVRKPFSGFTACILGALALTGGLLIMLVEEAYIWTADDKNIYEFSEKAIVIDGTDGINHAEIQKYSKGNKGVRYIEFPAGNIETLESVTVLGSEPKVYFLFGDNGHALLDTRPFGRKYRIEKHWCGHYDNFTILPPSKIYPGKNQSLVAVSYNPSTGKKGKVWVKTPSIKYRKIE